MPRNAPGGNPALEFVTTGSKESREIMGKMVERQLQRDPFAQFMGEAPTNCVVTVGETAKKGTAVTVFLASDLVGAGVKGNQNLDENIDQAVDLPFTFRGNVLANSFESPVDKLFNRSALSKARSSNKNRLINWMALHTIKEKFYTIANDATNKVCVDHAGTVVAAPANLAAGDVFSSYVLDEMLNRAENGYTAGGVEHPALETQYIERKTEHGMELIGEFYPVFVGPQSYKNLTEDPRWQEAQKSMAHTWLSIAVRGFAGVYKNAVIIKVGKTSAIKPGIIRSDSPDFTGMSGSYAGFEAQYKAGDNTVTEVNFIMGSGALALGFDEDPRYAENGNWDSSRKILFWADQFFGTKKVRFVGESAAEQASIYHNKDYGIIVAPSTIV